MTRDGASRSEFIGYVPIGAAAIAAVVVTALAPRGRAVPLQPETPVASSVASAAHRAPGPSSSAPPTSSSPRQLPPPKLPVLRPPPLAQLTKNSQLSWQLFAADGFRVALPAKPKDFEFTSRTLLGELTQRGIEAKLGSIATFSAAVTSYPRGPRSAQERSTYYMHARHQTRSRVKGNETSSRQITLAGQPAERFGGAISNVRSYEAVAVALGSKMYVLLIDWKSGALDLGERDTFFNSLALGKTTPPVASARPRP